MAQHDNQSIAADYWLPNKYHPLPVSECYFAVDQQTPPPPLSVNECPADIIDYWANKYKQQQKAQKKIIKHKL